MICTDTIAIKSSPAYPHGKSATITMYLSCGTLDYATRVFESIDEPEAMAWTDMIARWLCLSRGLRYSEMMSASTVLFQLLIIMILWLVYIPEWVSAVTKGYFRLYILMFTLNASVRKMMTERSLRKEVSCSRITYCKGFIVGEKNHPKTEDFYSKLEALSDSVTKEETDLLTEAVSDSFPERKEQPLFRNLRACEDCHDFGRESEIIVRDSSDSITSSQGNVLAMTTGDPTQRCITAESFVS
ncbi:REPEAT-CONTAINING PROTEIN putative-RELATED [Salix koriyanagi]|uniref:REPEAT-CONTAINING PROTEIN putative-RELATED n=1 Tax=Salix koriyanagi TaxID=2511006 RepID=A0A9Q0PVB8_9ROSI|nr:REPEAT-CONTAINING PROTEIN putative-RELATED [Salix koriyanagi]